MNDLLKEILKPESIFEVIGDWFKRRLGIRTRREKMLARMIYAYNPNATKEGITITHWGQGE